MQISFSWPPARCKFHSVGPQPDANCIRLAAMQYKIPKFMDNLHVPGHQPNEICIRLVASWMEILWNKRLAYCFASVLKAPRDDIF
jgi:hypothetical protein